MVDDHKTAVNVLVVQPNGAQISKRLKSDLPFLHVECYQTHSVSEIKESTWRKCEVLYTEKALPLPEQVPNLKWIQFHYAGIDYSLDAPLLAKPNLLVTTLSGVPALPMGEYVIMYILSFGHRIFEMKELQRQRNWPENRFDVLCPSEIRKSTLGIIGYGSTGREVARLAKEFGARVIATKRNPSNLIDRGYRQKGRGDPDGRYLDFVYPIDKLCEMLSVSDFVVVSVPLTKDTRKMIGRKELNSIKRNSLLIDVSRGGVIDHDALIEVISSGHLAGAVLDVFPEEPLQKTSPLWSMPNVIITPHISGYSPYYFEDAYNLFVENLKLYLEGKPLLNKFNRFQGY